MSTTPTNITNKDIRELADKLSMLFRKENSEGDLRLDLVPVLKVINADVLPSQGKESSQVNSDGSFNIYIPSMTSNRRDRFTICHEIGHYFLHYKIVDTKTLKLPLKFGRGERNRAETQANVFASSFLMPEQLFKEEYKRQKGDSWAVARSFDVSPAAAQVRAQVLGLE